MRLLLDATAIPADLGGVGRYAVELVPALTDLGVQVLVVCRPGTESWVQNRAPAARVHVAPAWTGRRSARMLWEQTHLPALVRSVRPEVVLSPHYTTPLLPVPAARVVTLHDATFFSDPGLHLPAKARFFRQATRVAVRRADALVVPSDATRREVLRHAGGRPDLFHVAPHGVHTATFHPVDEAERERVAKSLGLAGRPYVAFLGTLEPRKNVPALVRGWVRAVRGRPNPPALVLAGGAGWDHRIDDAIRDVPPALEVFRPGYLPLADLPGFLGGAEVVAYPSLGEGFGLPVLEAMACGATVLTSRALSLPEVGGEAVAYTGTDEGDIADALAGLLTRPDRRLQLAALARVRAARFTWERAAQLHVTAFEAAVVRHRG